MKVVRLVAVAAAVMIALGLMGVISLPSEWSWLNDSDPASTARPCGGSVPSSAKPVMVLKYVTAPNSLEANYPAHRAGTESDRYQLSEKDDSVQVRLRPDWSGAEKGWVLSNAGSQPVIIQTFNCTKRVEPGNRFPDLFGTEQVAIEVYLP